MVISFTKEFVSWRRMWNGGGRLGLRYQADKHESQSSSLLIDGKDAGGSLEKE